MTSKDELSAEQVRRRILRLAAMAAKLRDADLASGQMARAVRAARRTAVVEMSLSAVERRLHELGQLSDLCRELAVTTRPSDDR